MLRVCAIACCAALSSDDPVEHLGYFGHEQLPELPMREQLPESAGPSAASGAPEGARKNRLWRVQRAFAAGVALAHARDQHWEKHVNQQILPESLGRVPSPDLREYEAGRRGHLWPDLWLPTLAVDGPVIWSEKRKSEEAAQETPQTREDGPVRSETSVIGHQTPHPVPMVADWATAEPGHWAFGPELLPVDRSLSVSSASSSDSLQSYHTAHDGPPSLHASGDYTAAAREAVEEEEQKENEEGRKKRTKQHKKLSKKLRKLKIADSPAESDVKKVKKVHFNSDVEEFAVGDYDRMNWDFMDDLRKRHDLIRKWEKIVRNVMT